MNNDIKGKPLPQVTDLTRPFWTAGKRGELLLQKCGKCGTFNFFPKPWCVACGSRDLTWTEARPFGTVYTFTISRNVSMNYPGWEGDLPVLMCLIDLDDGARLYGQVTGCRPEDMKIGMRVRAYFEDISDELSIPKFHPEQ